MVNNESLKFLLPLIGDTYNPNFYLKDNFIGCFVGDVNKPEMDGNLLLVYNYPQTIEWANYEEKLMQLPNFKGDYDYGDKGYVIYSFSLDDNEEDFENIINGYYSNIDPNSKLRITKFWEKHNKNTLINKILTKDNSLDNMWKSWKKRSEDYCSENELWYKPDLNMEIFNKEYKY